METHEFLGIVKSAAGLGIGATIGFHVAPTDKKITGVIVGGLAGFFLAPVEELAALLRR